MCQIDQLRVYMRCKTPELTMAVFVQWKPNLQVGLCQPCWERFCDNKKDFECGPDPKIENFKEWLEKGRGLEGAVPTEYNPAKKGVGKYKTIQQEDEEITAEDELTEAEGKTLKEEDEEREREELAAEKTEEEIPKS